MSDILSPEEINALLGASRTVENIGKKQGMKSASHPIRLYDFSRPDRFSKEHIRGLSAIHSRFATGFAITLGRLLHTTIETNFLAVDLVSYREYCASVPENTLFCEMELTPTIGSVIFEVNANIAGACIDGLTGGSGAESSEISEFTEIDCAIMVKVIDMAMRKYEEVWTPYAFIRAKVLDAVSKVSFNHNFLPTEHMVVCSFEVTIGSVTGMMSMCLPGIALEPILPSLAQSRLAGANAKQSSEAAVAIEQSLQDVPLDCTAILGRTTLTMEEVVGLQEGDIITIKGKPGNDVELWVGDKKAFTGAVGRTGRNVGLKIMRSLWDAETSGII